MGAIKATAEKSSTASATRAEASHHPFIARAGGGDFFPRVQTKMTVGKPGDKFEQEADKTADNVMRMPAPQAAGAEKLQRQPEDKIQRRREEKILRAAAPDDKIQKAPADEQRIQRRADEKILRAADDKIQKAPGEKIQKAGLPPLRAEEQILRAPDDKVQKSDDHRLQKAPAEGERLQRDALAGGGAPTVSGNVQSAIHGKTTGGEPLASDVRSYMEPRFSADFSNVRVHHDAESASFSNQLSARAFTYQNHIFFSRDQYQPSTSGGQHLLAHELTHTIQQGHAVQRSPQVSVTTTPPPIQRLGVQDALDYFADKALNIPGFRMLTVLLGFNPINMRSVDRNAANLLRALIELIPGGHLITQALDNHGVINKAAAWLEQKIAILGDIGGAIIDGLHRFIDSLSWTDIFDLGGVWDRAKRIFTEPIGRLIDFGVSVAVEILKMVKDAILKPLAALAKGTRGYDLLCAILGEDPISGEPVPRTAETLLGGFMKLIGQEEIWENIKKGNAIARAYAWFQTALSGLMGLVRAVPHRIVDTLTSLTFQDVITVAGALGKIIGAFVNIAVDFISWGLNQVLGLLEIIFSVVAPGVMPYIKKAQAAFATIIKNPIGFVGNLVRAGKQGFQMFASNILEHLKAALIKWIVGPLADAGVYIPRSFTLIEIVKLVLSVLGLTWQNIRSKLVQIIPEPVLVGLEKTAGILVTLARDGPAAAWEQIKAELTELKDQLISQITQMITSEVVKAAVTKLVTMLNPAGAVIQAIIAIYNTITFFIQKIQQIAMVVAAFIDSIAEIAAGQTDAAAKKVEQTMANALTVVIAFLAKFAGLGNIPEKVVGIVRKIRQPIDKGLDKIVAWLGNMLKKLGGAVSDWIAEFRKPKAFQAGRESHTAWISPDGHAMVASTPSPARAAVATLQVRLNQMPPPSRPEGASTKVAEADAAIAPVEAQAALASSASGKTAPPGLRAAWDSLIVKLSSAYSVFAAQGVMPAFPPMTFNFNSSKYTGAQRTTYEAECRKQLRDQQQGLNNLKAGEWLANRARYTAVGRSASDTANIAEYRNLLHQQTVNIRLKILEATNAAEPPPRQQQAETFANKLLGGSAVLHIPDQIAGGALLFPQGKPLAVSQYEVQVGLQGVNSAIGAGWGWKTAELAQLGQAAAAADPLVKMNLTLTPAFT